MNIHTRAFDPAQKGEAETLFDIFFQAARIGAKNHYTKAQRKAWMPSSDMPDGWPKRITQLDTWVAEVDGDIVGFMAANDDGYLDLAFVRPLWMGRGVAKALYERLIENARTAGLTRMTTHASHLARPFFARAGWQVDTPEKVEKDGEVLERFAMSIEFASPQ